MELLEGGVRATDKPGHPGQAGAGGGVRPPALGVQRGAPSYSGQQWQLATSAQIKSVLWILVALKIILS